MRTVSLLLVWGLALAVVRAEPEPGLRAALYEVAGALGNEGFKVRDGIWSGKLEAGVPQRLAVNLFAGNHYWFLATAGAGARGLELSLFDSAGRPVPVASEGPPGLAVAGVTAGATGQYFLQIGSAGGPTADFRLLYLFK